MAKIKNIQLKSVRNIMGREGYGLLCNIYFKGKKAAEYADYGDGGMASIEFVSKDIEEAVMHEVFAYHQTYPNEFILKLYQNNMDKYETDKKRVLENMPYISEDEVTPESLSGAEDISALVNDLCLLAEYEKQYRKTIKKGYKYLAIKENEHNTELYMISDKYECGGTEEDLKKEYTKVFSSLEDFIIR